MGPSRRAAKRLHPSALVESPLDMTMTLHGRAMRLARVCLDAAALSIAWLVAFELRFEFAVPGEMWRRMVLLLPYMLLCGLGALSLIVSSRRSWRHVTLTDARRIALAMVSLAGLLGLLRWLAPKAMGRWALLGEAVVPWGVIGMFLPLAFTGLVAVRVLRRWQVEVAEQRGFDTVVDRDRVLLVGAGRVGRAVCQEITSRPDLGLEVVGYLDDDPAKRGSVIADRPVLGSLDDLEAVMGRYLLDEAVITITDASPGDIRRVLRVCEEAGLATKIVPEVGSVVDGSVTINSLRPVEIEDLLGREPVELELDAIREYVSHDVVMVTGAGGSIGSELCRQLLSFGPRQLLLVERSEPSLWAIDRELQTEARESATEVLPYLGDVTDHERIDHLVLTYRPSVIFHAAAHKHVPMCERNPGEAIKNNVLGTKTVVDVAADRGVERFVLISTDKAVNPTSVMGATKRVAERYVQHVAVTTDRPYVAVRFGNVLGSTGSVVPIFKDQIARGGPVTVTHPDMTRYFMTIPEASRLVLQAAVLGAPGEVLVLDMGEPVKIVQLAEDLIRLSGLTPYTDIPIDFTGIRNGEKLYEELGVDEDHGRRTRHPKISIDGVLAAAMSAAADVDRLLGSIAAAAPELRPLALAAAAGRDGGETLPRAVQAVAGQDARVVSVRSSR